tara:strand:- start:427 stop:657 length:231 start_codon:yes stop_codon:yes gene_type:complete
MPRRAERELDGAGVMRMKNYFFLGFCRLVAFVLFDPAGFALPIITQLVFPKPPPIGWPPAEFGFCLSSPQKPLLSV